MTTSPNGAALLRIGTRGSPLALAQAHQVRDRLRAAHEELARDDALEIVVIKTSGDKFLDRPLADIGGKGLFTKEIEEALLDKRIDLAVHSMKDVPTWLPGGLTIGAILPRADPRDAFFSRMADSLDALPEGALVGSASLRRQAQIRLCRPDLEVVTFRGNVQSRLRKLADGEVQATLLAVAGLQRLGLADQATAVLSTEVMLPAVAQGAIGLEIRDGDTRTAAFLAPLDDAESNLRVRAERACLEVLDGSCRTPIAALAELQDGGLRLRALIAQPDGSACHRAEQSGNASDAEALGRAVGEELLAAAGPAFMASLRHD